MMPTGILVNGHNLRSRGDDWEQVAFGIPPFQLGRLTRAVQLGMSIEDELRFIFGTGASSVHGLREAQFSKAYLLSRWDDLRQFAAFRGRANDLKLMRRCIVSGLTELESRNTLDEIAIAGSVLESVGCTRLYLVSSPTHISRVARDACNVATKRCGAMWQNLHFVPSHTCFRNTNPWDVVIFEPSHRVDREDLQLHSILRHAFDVPPEAHERFCAELRALFSGFGIAVC
jgi:hypothetical protein